MDWMGLEKIEKKFDLFRIQTHPIPLNPHGLRANRTSPKGIYGPATRISGLFIFLVLLTTYPCVYLCIYGEVLYNLFVLKYNLFYTNYIFIK
jgi:hypothetical protein